MASFRYKQRLKFVDSPKIGFLTCGTVLETCLAAEANTFAAT